MDIKEREQAVIKLYVEQEKTCTIVADELGLERKTVYRILNRLNIPLRESKPGNCVICNTPLKRHTTRRCGTCSTAIRRYRVKKKAVEYKGGICKCGWSGDISGFDFHHRNPEEKEFDVTAKNMANMKWEVVKKELDKCDLLCAVCHRLTYSQYSDPIFLAEAENYTGTLFK